MVDSRCGAIPSLPDKRNYRLLPSSYTQLPLEYLERKMPTHIVDQGYVGNCVAQSINYCFSVYYGMPFTANWIYGHREPSEYQGRGWYLHEGIDTAKKEGNLLSSMDTENALEVKDVISHVKNTLNGLEIKFKKAAESFKIKSYAQLRTEQEIKEALFTGLFVVCSVPIKTDNPYENGIWDCSENKLGSHAISLWGWRADGYFRMVNSWGDDWGENGFAWISSSDVLRQYDVWGFTFEEREDIVPPKEEEDENLVISKKDVIVSGVGEGKILNLYSQKEALKAYDVGDLRDGDRLTLISESGTWGLVVKGESELVGWTGLKYLVDALNPPVPFPTPPLPIPEDEVGKLQWYLHKWGFGSIVGAIDSKMGSNTKKATMHFQSAMSLVSDGIAGKNTWEALYGDVIVPRLTEQDAMCQCVVVHSSEPYCNGYPSSSTIGVRILAERILRELEKTYPGVELLITTKSTPSPDGSCAGGQRCAKWNDERGGAEKSQHLYGTALDVYGRLDGVSDSLIRDKIEEIALEMNKYGGVGYGAKYIVHIDIRGRKSRWEY